MELFTQAQFNQLLTNGRQQQQAAQEGNTVDPYPVIKLFTPDANATWLITEVDPDEPDIAFGLCDLGAGFPELGSVSLTELRGVRGKAGLPIERDLHFQANKPLSAYTAEARQCRYIKT